MCAAFWWGVGGQEALFPDVWEHNKVFSETSDCLLSIFAAVSQIVCAQYL